MDFESQIMSLIVNGGDGKGIAIEALRMAKAGDFEEADRKMEEAEKVINEAHGTQTELIQSELNGSGVPINLLMVHAQDHLMNAITVIDLCREMIDILREKEEK